MIIKTLTAIVTISAMTMTAQAVPITPVITITQGNNPGDTDNVLFNDSSLDQGPGLLVQGNFNGNGSGYIVDFTSTSGNGQLSGTQSGGQARVQGVTGNNPFLNIAFGLEDGATFTYAVFNVDSADNVRNDIDTIAITVSYLNGLGSPFSTSFDLRDNGSNFFTVEALDGAQITSISLNTTDSSFEKLEQVRIGGFSTTSVPDGGSSLALLGLGLLGMGAIRRKLS